MGGWIEIRVRGAGDCFFHALAVGLERQAQGVNAAQGVAFDVVRASTVRVAIADHLARTLFNRDSQQLFTDVTARDEQTTPGTLRARLEQLERVARSRDAALCGLFDQTVGLDRQNGGHWGLACWTAWLRHDAAAVASRTPATDAQLLREVYPHAGQPIFGMLLWGDTDVCRDVAGRVYPGLAIGVHLRGQPLPAAPAAGQEANEIFLFHKGNHFDVLVYDPQAAADHVPGNAVASFAMPKLGELAAYVEEKEPEVSLAAAFARLAARTGTPCSRCGLGLKPVAITKDGTVVVRGCHCLYCEAERRSKDGAVLAKASVSESQSASRVDGNGLVACPEPAEKKEPPERKVAPATFVVRYRTADPLACALSKEDEAAVGAFNEAPPDLKALAAHLTGTAPIADARANLLGRSIVLLVPGGKSAAPLASHPVADWREHATVVHVASPRVTLDDQATLRELWAQMDLVKLAHRAVFLEAESALAATLCARAKTAAEFVSAAAAVSRVKGPKKPESKDPDGDADILVKQLDGLRRDEALFASNAALVRRNGWFLAHPRLGDDWLGRLLPRLVLEPADAPEHDLGEITNAELKAGKGSWPPKKIAAHVDAVASEVPPSERKANALLAPQSSDAKSLRRICFDCLPERLRYIVWSLVRSPWVIDSALDSEVDSITPKAAASMRSWHNDNDGNLPRTPAPDSAPSLPEWLVEAAHRFGGLPRPEATRSNRKGAAEAAGVPVQDTPANRKAGRYHAYVTTHKGIQGKATTDSGKKQVKVEAKGYAEYTSTGRPYPDDNAASASGFLGYDISAGGDRIIYDYVNHRVFVSPAHYQGEEHNPFLLVEDVPVERPFAEWPEWIVRRSLDGTSRRSNLKVLRDVKQANSQRRPGALDDVYLHVLRRLAAHVLADAKAKIAAHAPGVIGEDELAKYFAGTGKVVTDYFPLPAEASNAKPVKGAKPAPKKNRTFPVFDISGVKELFGTMRALGANGEGPVGCVLRWNKGDTVGILTPTDTYFYPLVVGKKAVAHQHLKVDYPELRKHAPTEEFEALQMAATGVADDPLAFTCAVANWLVENTRNHAQFPLLLLLSTLGVSPPALLVAQELPVADGGWQNRTSWGLGANPSVENAPAEPSALTARCRFGLLLQRYVDSDDTLRTAFERIALERHALDEELEAWLYGQLEPVVERIVDEILNPKK